MPSLISTYRKRFANIVRWLPFVWRDLDYDYGPLLNLLQFKLCNMADYHEHHGHLVNNARYVHQMRVCAKLCHRIRENNYFQLAAPIAGQQLLCSEDAGRSRSQQLALKDLLRERDLKLLTYMLGRHLLDW